MQERILIQERGVLVSTTRLATPTTTYALAQITSVRAATTTPSGTTWQMLALGAFVLAMSGGTCLVADSSFGVVLMVLAAICLVAALLVRRTLKPTYHVVVVTAAGEVPAISDGDWDWIARVVHALNAAIVSRG